VERNTAHRFPKYVLEHIAALFSLTPTKLVAGPLGFEDPNDPKMLKDLCPPLHVQENDHRLLYPYYYTLGWGRIVTELYLDVEAAHRRMLITALGSCQLFLR
jgi:hypothetical protein